MSAPEVVTKLKSGVAYVFIRLLREKVQGSLRLDVYRRDAESAEVYLLYADGVEQQRVGCH